MNHNHAERDQRFAFVSTGDITSWARTCSSPAIKRTIRVKRKASMTVKHLEAIKQHVATIVSMRQQPTKPLVPCKVIPKGNGNPSPDKEIAKMDKNITNTAASLSISNKLNALFAAKGANLRPMAKA